jgi:hypothetical protein
MNNKRVEMEKYINGILVTNDLKISNEELYILKQGILCQLIDLHEYKLEDIENKSLYYLLYLLNKEVFKSDINFIKYNILHGRE